MSTLTKIEFAEDVLVPCPTCRVADGRPGWILNNPNWPNGEYDAAGTNACWVRCTDCSGETTVPLNELGGDAHDTAKARLIARMSARAEADAARQRADELEAELEMDEWS